MLTPRQVIDQAKKNLVGPDLAAPTDGDLAFELRRRGLKKVDASTVGRWRREENYPGWIPALTLLEMAGWLTAEALAAGLAADARRQAGEEEKNRQEPQEPSQQEPSAG